MDDVYTLRRENMVNEQLKGRGIIDKKILKTFMDVPRHLFVPAKLQDFAYDDSPLSIGYGQTISQPYMVAIMTALLSIKPEDILLEIGTGSGYQAAIASKLCRHVYTVERIAGLADFARDNIDKMNIKNMTIVLCDGSIGFPEKAPYDKILYTAATPQIPDMIFEQLKVNGSLVAPEGDQYSQLLVKYLKEETRIRKEKYFGCIFVPLIGKHGLINE